MLQTSLLVFFFLVICFLLFFTYCVAHTFIVLIHGSVQGIQEQVDTFCGEEEEFLVPQKRTIPTTLRNTRSIPYKKTRLKRKFGSR